MTPSSLRSALQERLRSNMDAVHLAGTIKSLDGNVNEDSENNNNNNNNNVKDKFENQEVKEDEQKLLPPSIPKYLRRQSKEDEKIDKIDIDAENIETPPVTRRALGIRSFKSPEDNQWMSQKLDEEQDLLNRRNKGKFRSLNSDERKALVGEKLMSKDGGSLRRRPRSVIDSSENEGNVSELEEPASARRFMRFKYLADLAKDGDSETEQMLLRQEKTVPTEDDLGDGNFKRFSSVRKTLRHKKGLDKTDTNSEIGDIEPETALKETLLTNIQQSEVESLRENGYEDKNSRLKRWQKVKDDKSDDMPGEHSGGDSWKDKFSLKFKHGSDKYNVQKAMNNQSNEPKPPASKRTNRKNKDNLARGVETRGSFRLLSSEKPNVQNKRFRNKSAIDASQVKEALEKNKSDAESRGMSRLFDRISSKASPASNRKITKVSPNNSVMKTITKDEKDDVSEETGSLQSETPSQGTSSNSGDIRDSTKRKNISNKSSPNKPPESRSLVNSLKSREGSRRSSSHTSLRSSSATSINTVRQGKNISKSPSNTSLTSTRSDASNRSRTRRNDVPSSPITSLKKTLRQGLGRSYDASRSSPTSPQVYDDQPSFPNGKTRSSSSIHSSGGASQSRPLSRADSNRSVGSLSKQSSESSLRQNSSRGLSNSLSNNLKSKTTKKPLTPTQSKTSTNNIRNRSFSGSNSSLKKSPRTTPNNSVKVKRGDSGSSKENLSLSNSGNSRTTRSTSRSTTPKMPLSDRYSGPKSPPPLPDNISRSTSNSGSTTKSGRRSVPAFMRPTTASSSKILSGEQPKKTKPVSRSASLQNPRMMIK